MECLRIEAQRAGAVVLVSVAEGENIVVIFLKVAHADPDEGHRAATAKGDGFFPLGQSAVLPFSFLWARDVDLHVAVGIGFMVGEDRFIL